MTVVVEMTIRPPDPAAFRAACTWVAAEGHPDGLHTAQVLADENGSGAFCLLQEWSDHDSYHAYTDRIGDEFNRRAGTVGLEWRTNVWAPTDFPTP